MLLVLGLAAAIWGIGAAMKVPLSARWPMLGLLYVAVLIIHIILPAGHPLRMATGESAAFWGILGGAVALVLAYRWLLGRVRARAQPKDQTLPKSGSFTETELDRYARHIVLREIGGVGQKSLKNARVLVIGAGGLGAPALQYLGAAGVGTIGVIDDDIVENTNLQRQVIHTDARIGTPKVFSAQEALKAQNPFIMVKPYNRRFEEVIAKDLFSDFDLVLDGTDNFDTRYLANATAVGLGIPLVSGALTQWEGQISVFDPKTEGPCYQCVFPQAPAAELAPNCAEAGVLGPLPGVIGAMMAVEAVKLITGAGTPMRGQLLIYDALYGETRTIRVKPRADCPVCRQRVSSDA